MKSMRKSKDLVEENAALARDNSELGLKLVEQQVKVEELMRARDKAIRARDAALERWEQTMAEMDLLRVDAANATPRSRRFDPAQHKQTAGGPPTG